jgi:hypothetical protein
MDFMAVMVPESSLPQASAIVRGVEACLSDARLAIDEDRGLDDPLGACAI